MKEIDEYLGAPEGEKVVALMLSPSKGSEAIDNFLKERS